MDCCAVLCTVCVSLQENLRLTHMPSAAAAVAAAHPSQASPTSCLTCQVPPQFGSAACPASSWRRSATSPSAPTRSRPGEQRAVL